MPATDMQKIFNVKDALDGLFLVFLAIMSSFTFKLLGCPLQILLANNLIARHLVYLVVVLFTTSFLSDGSVNPLYHFFYAFCVYLFIIIFTKMRVVVTIIVFMLLVVIYISHLYMKYFNYKIDDETEKDKKIVYQNYVDKLSQLNNIIIILAIVITIIGFIRFTIFKKAKYGKKFNLVKFLFGIRLCKYD
jgi:hypothetical protein